MKKNIITTLIIVVLAIIAYIWVTQSGISISKWWQSFSSNKSKYVQDDELILYGNIDIRTVNLSFRVAGRLDSLTVDEGDTVKKGQLIGQLDDQSYQIALQQAKASVGAAQSQLDLQLAGYRQEEIDQAKAQVSQYEAAYRYAESTFERQQKLAASKTISADQLDNARTARDQARAALQTARDRLNQYQNGFRPQEIDVTRANVALAQSSLAQAELSIADAQLISPSDGIVLTRITEPGTLLAAGSPVISLSLTSPVWARAYIDEMNLSHAVPGRYVDIYSDSNPGKVYKGKIGFVSPTAEFTPKSVETELLRTSLVYRLRIIIENADDGLRQGMPVTIAFTDKIEAAHQSEAAE